MGKVFSWSVREQAYGLFVRGWSAETIGARLGVHSATVARWAMLAGMKLDLGARGGVGAVDLQAVPAVPAGERSYRRLTLADRSFIQAARALAEPLSIRAIARELGVAASTVSRELRHHQIPGSSYRQGRYVAEVAQHRAIVARHRSVPKRLDDPVLRGEVVKRLQLRFSPEQIAGQLRLDFPGRLSNGVCKGCGTTP